MIFRRLPDGLLRRVTGRRGAVSWVLQSEELAGVRRGLPLPERRRGGDVPAKFIVFGQCAIEAVPVTVVLPGQARHRPQSPWDSAVLRPGIASPYRSNNMQL